MNKRLMRDLAHELGRSPDEPGTARLRRALDETPPKTRPGRWERLGRIVAAANAVVLGVAGGVFYTVAARGHGDVALLVIACVCVLGGVAAAVVALRSTW
jgi:hypothetical protein